MLVDRLRTFAGKKNALGFSGFLQFMQSQGYVKRLNSFYLLLHNSCKNYSPDNVVTSRKLFQFMRRPSQCASYAWGNYASLVSDLLNPDYEQHFKEVFFA